EQSSESGHASLNSVVPFHHQLRIGRQANLLHRSQERLVSGCRRFKSQRPRNERDFFVTESSQMLHRLPDSVQIVDPDIADARARRSDVDKYQGYLPELQILE